MPLTIVVTEAAHKYGFDDFTDASLLADVARVGRQVSSETSLGRGARPGDVGSATTHHANGYSYTGEAWVDANSTVFLTAMALVRRDSGETLQHWSSGSGFTANLFSTTSSVFSGSDTLIGNSYSNALQGWGGNDSFDGGAGVDTVVLSGFRSQYTITRSGDTITTKGPDGTDTLVNVERLKFSNGLLALDTAGNAGQAYRLYQAAFNRKPDESGLGFQIKTLDAGHALKAVAQNFLNSPEFARTYGNLSDSAFIDKLYQNVLHRPADAGGLAHHLSDLGAGRADRAQLLVNFSESPENQAALIGTIQNGITYFI